MSIKDNGHEEAEAFPVRVAATDIGSNAIRFLASEFASEGHFEVLEQLRVPVRLGHDVFLTGKLTDDAMDAAIDALATFAHKLHDLVAPHRAVCYSTVTDFARLRGWSTSVPRATATS